MLNEKLSLRGPYFAILAALLFGVSPVLIKVLIGDIPPLVIAGLLYMGSGVGLVALSLASKENILSGIRKLAPGRLKKLIGAIISGGILAPICLAYGIKLATAFEVSLLLNLETVATTIIAAIFFHEYIGKRVWLGKGFILFGAVVVSFWSKEGISFSFSSLFVMMACVFWGIDNNLTRDVEDLSPVSLAAIKGITAGVFNLGLAISLNMEFPIPVKVIQLLTIGSLSYGLSLVLFVQSLRLIGSSRTTTYFAAGPFIGILASVALLGEHPPSTHWLATVFAFAGVWLLVNEQHEHTHTHEPITHSHRHVHDEHHQHYHDGMEGAEPHEHTHTHDPITHRHSHLPDIHHRHQH